MKHFMVIAMSAVTLVFCVVLLFADNQEHFHIFKSKPTGTNIPIIYDPSMHKHYVGQGYTEFARDTPRHTHKVKNEVSGIKILS